MTNNSDILDSVLAFKNAVKALGTISKEANISGKAIETLKNTNWQKIPQPKIPTALKVRSR